MREFKPLQASFSHRVFAFKGKHRFTVSVMFGFPFAGRDALPEPELWNLIENELGKDGVLDMGMPKPNGEVLVYGKCFAAKGSPVKSERVRVRIASIDKSLLVYGDRYWRALIGPTEPESFTEMPLDYAHAFGGTGFAKNPIGKGMVDVDLMGERRRPLPNIEIPDQVITSLNQTPNPAGFGPLDVSWEFRASRLGTYDDKWLKERWPAYADDLDWNHFNAAPPDQWLPSFFSGTEDFELVNMHPEKPVLRGQLPGFRTRCFVQRASAAEDEIDEIAMRAETLFLLPHVETGIILYRGAVDIETDDASDLQSIIVGYENLADEPRKTSHYAEQLRERKRGLHEMNTTALIPTGALCGFGALEENEEEDESETGTGSVGVSEEAIKQSRREELVALSAKLAEIKGAEAAKAKVDQAIIDLDLPPFFPRPDGYGRIGELIAAKHRAEKLPGAAKVTERDIHEAHAMLEEAGREMKEGYRFQAHLLVPGRPRHEPHLDVLREEFFARLEKKQSVAGWDWAGLDLSKADLSGIDLSGCYLEKVNFSDSNLTGANLEAAILAFANLSRCDLSGANLKRASLGAANLRKAVVDGADLTEAVLGRAELWGAKLVNCNMRNVDLHETALGDSDLSGSTLPGAQLVDLHMARIKFRQANLAGCTFSKCNLDESDFSGANLDKSTWIESVLDGANFTDAQMKNTRFPGGALLAGARFIRTVLDASNFQDADLRDADFTEASLHMCNFGGADARWARFTRAVATKAQFTGADLARADLSSINLMDGTLMKARLTSAILRNANCYGVDFMQATVGGTDFTGTNLNQTQLEIWRPA